MSIKKFTVSRDDSIYQAWPDLVLTKSGKLICLFTQCNHHGNRDDSHLVLCESYDRGRTWSDRVELTDHMPHTNFWNCARISRLKDDSLVIVCDLVKRDENTGETIVYMWKSDSEGTRWSQPIETPARGIVPDKLLELDNGRWIITCHKQSKDTKMLETFMWYSDDKGVTWSDKIIVASDIRYNLCEASVLPVGDDTLVCFMRENSGMGYDCLKSISYDNGETWNGVYNVPLPGCHRPVAGHLNNGQIMITYRFMQGGKGWLGSWTQNVFAAFMDIDSVKSTERKQQSARIMPLDFDRSPVSDLGYTGWVQFADGEIYVVNYIVDDAPNAQIRGYSFDLSDVIL